MFNNFNVALLSKIENILNGYFYTGEGLPDERCIYVSGKKVDKSDAIQAYNLIDLKQMLTKAQNMPNDRVVNFGNISICLEDYDKFIDLLKTTKGLKLPKIFRQNGNIPGTAIPAPMPKPDNWSTKKMERYLEDYYSRHGITPKVAQNGFRMPYPHEIVNWNVVAEQNDPTLTDEQRRKAQAKNNMPEGYVSKYYKSFVDLGVKKQYDRDHNVRPKASTGVGYKIARKVAATIQDKKIIDENLSKKRKRISKREVIDLAILGCASALGLATFGLGPALAGSALAIGMHLGALTGFTIVAARRVPRDRARIKKDTPVDTNGLTQALSQRLQEISDRLQIIDEEAMRIYPAAQSGDAVAVERLKKLAEDKKFLDEKRKELLDNLINMTTVEAPTNDNGGMTR